jgi:hypothetical protein
MPGMPPGYPLLMGSANAGGAGAQQPGHAGAGGGGMGTAGMGGMGVHMGGMQPGGMQPGMMQPGVMQPGVMQPGVMQPGMMQPGMLAMGGYPGAAGGLAGFPPYQVPHQQPGPAPPAGHVAGVSGQPLPSGISGAHPPLPLRRGKWTYEEEAYASQIIKDFNAGTLKALPGMTLRSCLSERLYCDPMRITKK